MTKRFKRIVICSDVFATSDSEQLSNLTWLFDSLKNPILKASGKMVQRFAAKEKTGFSRTKFFELSGITVDTKALQFDFDADKVSEKSIAYFKEFLDTDVLLLGYEFSRRTRAVLDKFGYTYIDLWLHPIRFLDDILFGFKSNNKAMFEAMAGFNYSDAYFPLYADRYKVSTYKGYRRRIEELKKTDENSALLVGQTMQDKAVLENGRFLNLLDFKKEIKSLAATHTTLYFSRHPYEKGDGEIMEFLKTIKNVKVTTEPAYLFLASDKVKTVAGISSSVVLEAKYFGKDTQYFHKPIFELSTKFGPESYASIMQDFMYPQFWAKVLAPIMPVKEVETVQYLDKKDKLRDMLAFYWSHKHIDKLEQMRGTLQALDRRVQGLDRRMPKPQPKPVAKKSRKINKTFRKDSVQIWKDIQAQVDSADVVSFDVFDTLVTRPLDIPNDLFSFMEPMVAEITGGKINGDFRKLRQDARHLAAPTSQCGEEVSLKERYDAIAKETGLPVTITDQLMELELSLEKTILEPRELMVSIMRYAKQQGKKVVIVSDTFFTSAFLKEMLAEKGITDYDMIWSSAEVKLLKHTGNVYPKLINELNVPAEKILHIGDNAHADIKMAEKHGIKTLWIPRTVDHFKKHSGLDKAYNFDKPFVGTMLKGMVANRMMDNPLDYSEPSHSGGSQFMLGYSMIAPMFFGFARWVMKNAMADGHKKVFFLARDGEIIKHCYDLMAKDIPNAPESEYLHVSRRALSVPSIQSEEDIREIAKINFSSKPIGHMLKGRFGINASKVNKAILTEHGFESIDQEINSNRDGKKFIELCVALKGLILLRARKERETMLEYLDSKGFDGKKETVVVDIGHNGTLQKRLNNLFDTTNIDGYYFVTQAGVKETIYDNGMKAKGYVAEEIVGSDKRHPYNKFILMFEACFLNTEGSMLYFEKDALGQLNKVQLPVHNEALRLRFIREIHSGVTSFVEDAIRLEKKLDIEFELGGRESINPYLSMLNHPYELDVLMYDKVSFENVYSGRDQNFLIYYDPADKEMSLKRSYWKDGLDGCSWEVNESEFGRGVVPKLISCLINMGNKAGLVSDSKKAKYERDPVGFCIDSKSKIIQNCAKHY